MAAAVLTNVRFVTDRVRTRTRKLGLYVTILALCDRTVSLPKRAAAREQTKRKENVTVVAPRDRVPGYPFSFISNGKVNVLRDLGCSLRSLKLSLKNCTCVAALVLLLRTIMHPVQVWNVQSEGACLTNGDRGCSSRSYATAPLRRLNLHAFQKLTQDPDKLKRGIRSSK